MQDNISMQQYEQQLACTMQMNIAYTNAMNNMAYSMQYDHGIHNANQEHDMRNANNNITCTM